MIYRFTHTIIVGLLMLSMACNSTSGNEEEGARYYEFTNAADQDYSIVAKTSDPEVIQKLQDQLELPFDQRNLHIHGDIERGNGGHNNNWSWHFTPGEWDMVEISAEVCDGRPQMVEDNLDYWINQVGYFCPWSSRVVSEVNP